MEYARVDEVFHPPLHRVNQVVRHRAIYGGDDIPPIPPNLLKYSHPPEDLITNKKTEAVLADLIETADVKKGIFGLFVALSSSPSLLISC